MANTDSALTIAAEVAAGIGFRSPATLVGQTDQNARLILSSMNRGGRSLARRRGPFGQSWPELTREWTIRTVRNQEWYALPADFVNLINSTAWDRDREWRALGPLSPQEWQQLKGDRIDTIGLTKRFRINYDPNTHLRALQIDPTPAASGEEVVLEYVSSYWLRAGVGRPLTGAKVTADSDIPIFPSDILELDTIWRVKKSQGLDYGADLGEFEAERDKAFAQLAGLEDIDLSGGSGTDPYDVLNTPESIPIP